MKGQKFFPLVVVAAGLLAYHNSFTGSYFHDDFGSIPENPTIRHLWPIWQPLSPPHRGGLTVESRPLINLSLAINYALGGYNVRGYHALNLMVHILAGLTLLGIVRRTLLQPALRERFGAAANELALAVAVLWTVHPLQTESVTYIVQRAESIMGLFYLLTLYCFIRGAESQQPRLWYVLSTAACALGMASKEVMISAPLMVLLYDRLFLSGSFRVAWRQRRSLYLGLSATWILLGLLLATGQVPTTFTNARRIDLRCWEYLATEPGVILYYLRLSTWPHPLSFDSYGWPIAKTWARILPPAVVVLILLAATAWAWRRRSAWGFVGAWFFLILAPSSSFIPLITPIYEHRMYLSLAAVVSLVVMGLYSLMGRRSLAVFTVAALGLGFLTWQRNQVYRKDPHYSIGIALAKAGQSQEAIPYFEQALRATAHDPEAHYNLGLALRGAGRVREAVDQLEQALQITPGFAEGQYNLGLTLMGLDRVAEAVEHLETVVGLKPDFAEAWYSLGAALVRLGRVEEAIASWEQALRIRPDYAEVHYNLGIAFAQLGRVPEAIEHWEQALRTKPDYAEVHNNLGSVLARTGRMSEAIDHWEQALRIQPDMPEAHKNLGMALLNLGRVEEAVDHLEHAVRLKPDSADAHYSLGVALEQTGKIEDATRHYEQALRIKPDYAEAQKALARLRTAR